MKLVWQVNEEWWGHHCLSHLGDYKATINEMDNRSFWCIRDDQKVVARGVTPGPYAKAQALVQAQLRRIKIKNFFRSKSVG